MRNATNGLNPLTFVDIPVFRPVPSAMFSSAIGIAARDEILAKGIPALSPAAGKTSMAPDTLASFNMNTAFKPDNGSWPNREYPYFRRWLHNDMQNMAFFYTNKLFKKLVKEGCLE